MIVGQNKRPFRIVQSIVVVRVVAGTTGYSTNRRERGNGEKRKVRYDFADLE